MSYYPDLSKRFPEPKTLNVGWLDGQHPFETARPPKWIAARLWVYCQYSLLHAGGFHECNLPCCPGPARKVRSLLYQGNSKSALSSEERMRQFLQDKVLSKRTKANVNDLLRAF